nr:reverse transcriptase domain-containing protein [Tanacetum cinerariifolium]
MSTNEQTPLSQPTSVVRNTLEREQALQNLVRPVPDKDLREYYDKNYHQILPIITEKLHQEKVQQEKLKAVKARLNFEKASQYSELETPNRRRNLKEKLGPRGARTRSISPEQRRGRSKSPKEKGPERRTVFKRPEKGVFHRLRDKEKNVSAHSRGSERNSYYSSYREAESCYQSSRSKEIEIAFEKHRYKREYSRRTKAKSESEESAGGHWKSKTKNQKSTAKMERWAMPTWCHMFNATLTGNARVWFDDLPKESIDSYNDLKKAFLENYLQQKKCITDPVEIHNIKQRNGESTKEFVRRYKLECKDRSLEERWRPPIGNGRSRFHPRSKKPDRSKTSKGETSGMNKGVKAKQRERSCKDSKEGRNLQKRQTAGNIDGPMIIEAEMGGHCVHRIYVDGGSSSEILYEHCFSKFRPEIKNHLILPNTHLVGFSGEIIWPLGQISLLVRIGDEEHSTSARMNFMVVRSPSPYNGIIGRPRIRKIRAIPSTANEMIKFPVAGRIVTLQGSRIIPLECSMVSEPEVSRISINQVKEEKIQVATHLEYPEQTVAIGSTLTEEGRKELCGLLRRHLDVFAWKPVDMTGKRRKAPERNKAISEEVRKLVEASIMKEVHYHSWLSNPVMVKKHDDSWRMCVDFKDLNKACPKDGYPLPEIDWKGIFCYSKMSFGLKNAGATYQRLVDKAFQKQIGRNLEVYVDDLVIKSRTEEEVIRDAEETFQTLRKINMKLNPKKCAFGMREGTFLGYKVDADGLRVSSDKVKAVIDLPSPKCLKDVQKLNGKLASLNRFLSKSAEKSLPFFKTLKKRTKKSDFQWTLEAEEAFKEMKQSIAELPMLTAPKEKED